MGDVGQTLLFMDLPRHTIIPTFKMASKASYEVGDSQQRAEAGKKKTAHFYTTQNNLE